MATPRTAVKILLRNIDRSDAFYQNYATLGDIYLEQKKYTKAMLTIAKELEFNSKQPKRQLLLAQLLLKSKRVEQAIEHYKEALKEDKRNLKGLLGLGHCYAELGDVEKAFSYLKRMRRYEPSDISSLKAMLRIAFKHKGQEQLISLLKREIGAYSDRIEPRIYLIKLHLRLDQIPQAEAALNSLCKVFPDRKETMRLQATVQVKVGAFEAALATYKKLAKRHPSLNHTLGIADCLMRMHRHKECHDVLTRALDKVPGHPKSLTLLATNMMGAGELAKAYHVFAMVKDPGNEKKVAYCIAALKKRRAAALAPNPAPVVGSVAPQAAKR